MPISKTTRKCFMNVSPKAHPVVEILLHATNALFSILVEGSKHERCPRDHEVDTTELDREV